MTPSSMTITALGKRTVTVRSMPSVGDSYSIPNNLTEIGRWSGATDKKTGVFHAAALPGSAPSNANLAIMLAHSGLDDKSGVFIGMTKLRNGTTAQLQGIDTRGVSGVLTLRLCGMAPEVPKYDPSGTYGDYLYQALLAAPSCARVATITCVGEINQAIGHHLDVGIAYWDVVSWTPGKGK